MQDNEDIFFQSEDTEVEEGSVVHRDQLSFDALATAEQNSSDEPAGETPSPLPSKPSTSPVSGAPGPGADSVEPALEEVPVTTVSAPEEGASLEAAVSGESVDVPAPPSLVAPEQLLSEAEAAAATDSMLAGIEALVFASGAPITRSEIRKVFAATWKDFSEDRQVAFGKLLTRAFDRFVQNWGKQDLVKGFELLDIGGGWVFRTVSVHAELLRALRTEKPTKLSRAALEVLSVVAYRQPTTKAEVDYVRGFLSLFNLSNLRQLPTLREYHELSEDSTEKLREFDGFPSIDELKENMVSLEEGDETPVADLEVAVTARGESVDATRDALAAEGSSLLDEDGK